MADTTPAIYKAIIGVMAEINAIGKDRKNQQQGFAYRGIDDVMNELHAALTKNKVFVVPEVLNEERSTGKTRSGGDLFYTRLKIRFTFYTDDGSSVSAVVIGEAMDSGDKASNKALSVGLKYAMLQVFCIPTEEMKDFDAETPEESSPKTASAKQIELLKKKYSPEMLVTMMEKNGIDRLEDLPMSKASEYIAYKGKENNNG